MDQKQLLFYHINCFWLEALKNMASQEPNNKHRLKILLEQIKNSVRDIAEDFWIEGHQLGLAISEHYQKSGVFEFSLNKINFASWRNFSEDYEKYLRSHIHAWAVPISYQYLFNNKHSSIDKALNLWGSTMSHTKYFSCLTDMTVEHLKKISPELPVGFVDIGCGDGSLLRLIKKKLKQVFQKDFIYVGFDIDERSCSIARQSDTNNIHFFKGDVAKPDDLNSFLISEGLPPLNNYFHLRAFVDHNCIPFSSINIDDSENINKHSDYFYLHNSTLISKECVEHAFYLHFTKWKKYIQKYGLGIIELHREESSFLTESPSIAYEIFHLLSEQYILPHHVFNSLCYNAGYKLNATGAFPLNKKHINVSISIYQ